MQIKEIQAKSILVKSGLPSDDYVVNPYSGCAFGCVYCYAEFTRRFQGHVNDGWGDYVDVRINAPELLDKEVKALIKRINQGKEEYKNKSHTVILMSSVTDPYQGVETRYKITRQCLEVFVENNFPGEVAILTKSPLVTRDIDLFKKLNKVSVGLTITTTDDGVSRLMEKHAPTASSRIRALAQLNAEGINTYVCVNPLLPHYVSQKENLDKLFGAIKDAGTNEVFVEHLNLSWGKRHRLYEELKDKVDEQILGEFWMSQKDEYKKDLEEIVYSILAEKELKILAGGIIDHSRLSKQ